MRNRTRQNDAVLFKSKELSRREKVTIAEGIHELLKVCLYDSDLRPLPKEFLFTTMLHHGTKLVGVVFDPSQGGTELGPYIGSILAFSTNADAVIQSHMIQHVCHLLHYEFGEEDMTERIIEGVRRRGNGRNFVLIVERSRMLSDYAKQEMAKLNSEFYGYLRTNGYMIVTVCRKSTSYKTYKKMESEGIFRFYVDLEVPYGYMDSREAFHLIFGEFLP